MVNLLHPYDVFVSYSHADRVWVHDWLMPRLECSDLRACIDFRDFEIGLPKLDNMERAVENSRHTLVVLTPAWLQSEWAGFEALLTQTNDPVGRRRRILPLMLEDCDPPRRLSALTYADFRTAHRQDDEMARVVRAIRAELPGSQPTAPLTTPPAIPNHPTSLPVSDASQQRLDQAPDISGQAKPGSDAERGIEGSGLEVKMANLRYAEDLRAIDGIWDVSAVVGPETILVVIGCHIFPELLDRPLAERLRDEIDRRGMRVGSRRAVVLGDMWWHKDSQLHRQPLIAIGGPNINDAAAAIDVASDRRQQTGRFNIALADGTPQVALSGEGACGTRATVERFVEDPDGLSCFLGLCWRTN